MATIPRFAVAAHLLKRAEKYTVGCHGPMDILTLISTDLPTLEVFDPAIVDDLDAKICANEEKAFTDLLSMDVRGDWVGSIAGESKIFKSKRGAAWASELPREVIARNSVTRYKSSQLNPFENHIRICVSPRAP
jgi:hypothetical protein